MIQLTPTAATATSTTADTAGAVVPGAPNADLGDAARRARLATAAERVGPEWIRFSGDLFAETCGGSLPDLEEWKREAYRRLAISPADFRIVRDELLAATEQAPYLLGLHHMEADRANDADNVTMVLSGIRDLMGGAGLTECTRRVMAAYAGLSVVGKAWFKLATTHTSVMEGFLAYCDGAAVSDGEAAATTDGVDRDAVADARSQGGASRQRGARSLYHLVRHGQMSSEAAGTEPAAPAAPAVAATTDAPAAGGGAPAGESAVCMDPAVARADAARFVAGIEAELTRGRAELQVYYPGGVDSWGNQLGSVARDRLLEELRGLPPEVQEIVRTDPTFMRAVLSLGSREGAQMLAALDPLERLYQQISPPPSPPGEPPPVRRPALAVLREYLLALPGDAARPQRMRVMEHANLAASIAAMGVLEREAVMRMIARGTEEPTAIDDLQSAVRRADAPGAVRAMMRAQGEDAAGVRALMGDLGFITNIGAPAFRGELEVDGAAVVPHDLFYMMCGVDPSVARDPGAADVAQGAAGEVTTFTPEDRTYLDTTLYQPTVAALDRMIVRGFWAGTTDNDDILTTIRGFQRSAASDEAINGDPQRSIVKLLRRAGEVAGGELTRKFNALKGEDLRGLLRDAVDDDTRRTCEEVLAMTPNQTAVGIIGGTAVLATDARVEGTLISLEQALRETLDGGQTLDEILDTEAANVHGELTDFFNVRSTSDMLAIWARVDARVTPHLGTISTNTGRPHIDAIELLANSYRTIGGDMYQALREAFADDGLATLTSGGMQVDAASRRSRAERALPAGEAAEARVATTFASPAQELFDMISAIGRDGTVPDVSAAAAKMTEYLALRADAAGAAPAVATRLTTCVPGAADVDGSPEHYYRDHFGITPRLQMARVIRGVGWPTRGWMIEASGLPESEVTGPIEASAMPSETAISDPSLVTPGFTVETATQIAQDIWRILHGDGEIQLITTTLLGNRTGEERRVINVQFRLLSGGIDPQFYLQEILSQRRDGGLRDSMANSQSTSVGAEGTEAGNRIATGDITVAGDAGAIGSAIDVARTGRIDQAGRLRAAVIQNNVNDIFRICDELTDADRRTILADSDLMTRLHGICDATAWDRVNRALTGAEDLVDRLASRSIGDRSSWHGGALSSTDPEGMRADITAYIRRIRDQVTATVNADESIREGQRPAAIEALVREACVSLLANPEVEGILRAELSGTELTNATGVIASGGGTSNEAALAGGGDVDAVITELRGMPAPERARHRADPEYLLELQRRTGTRYAEALRILNSDQVVGVGDDHLAALRTCTAGEVLGLLSRLTATEHATLRGDPELQLAIARRSYEHREAAVAMMQFDPAAASAGLSSVGITVADETDGTCSTAGLPREEVDRLAYLKFQAQNRIAASVSYAQLLEASIEIYRMNLRPTGPDTPPPPAGRDARGIGGVDFEDALGATENDLRGEIWAASRTHVNQICETEIARAAVEGGIKKQEDPSRHLLGETRAWHGDDEERIESTLRNTSDEKLIDDWSTVMQPGADGQTSLNYKYQEYRTIRSGGGERDAVEAKRMAVLRHVIDVSQMFERDVLPLAGGTASEETPGAASRIATIDNPEYHGYLRIVRERLPRITKELIAQRLGVADHPEDTELFQSSTSTTLSAEAYRTDAYLNVRGAGAGGMFGDTVATEEGAELDRYMAAYGHGNAEAQVNGPTHGEIDGTEAAAAAQRGGDVDRAMTQFTQARAATAQFASLLVATLIAVAISVFTMGAAAGPASALLLAMFTAGAAATGQVVTREMIEDQSYDASGEGMQTIATAVITGLITGGTSIIASRLIAGLVPAATAVEQAAVVGTASGARLAPTWGQVFSQAGRSAAEEVVGETMSNGIETGLAAVNPTIWMYGWDEGVQRASSTVRSELSARYGAPLRAGLISFLSAVASRGGGGGAGRPTTVDIQRNLATVAGGLPGAAREAFFTWAVTKATDQNFSWERAPEELLQEYLQEVRENAEMASTEGIDEDAAEPGTRRDPSRMPTSDRTTTVRSPTDTAAVDPATRTGDAAGTATGTVAPTITAPDATATAPVVGHAEHIDTVVVTDPATGATLRSEFQGRAEGRTPLTPEQVATGIEAATTNIATVLRGIPAAEGAVVTQIAGAAGTLIRVRLPNGTQITVTVRVAAAAMDEVAMLRSTDGDATIEISPTARPGDVGRAVAHDLAELMTRRLDPESINREDALAGRAATEAIPGSGELSHHDAGRIAELNFLVGEITAAATAGTPTADAARELRVLLAHMGFAWGEIDGRMTQLLTPAGLSELARAYALAGAPLIGSPQPHTDPDADAARAAADSNELGGSLVPGSSLRGTGRPGGASVAGVTATAMGAFPALAMAAGATRVEAAGEANTFLVWVGTDTFTVRVSALTLDEMTPARTIFNPSKEGRSTIGASGPAQTVVGRHVIQMSDQIDDAEIPRALVNELAVMMARRELTAAGDSDTPNMLGPDITPPAGAELSPADRGLVAQLNLLGNAIAADPVAAAGSRAQVAALIEHMGLREDTPGSAARMALITTLSPAALGVVNDLRRPQAALDAADQAALATVTTRAAADQTALDARAELEAPLHDMPTADVAHGDAGRGDRARLEAEAEARRDAVSQATMAYYRTRATAMPPGRLPNVDSPLVGAGASLAGRRTDQLLVDARGRWHADPSAQIAQSATQLGGLTDAGLGNPADFAAPNDRVPMAALRFWEDDIAAQGPCINGIGTIQMREIDGRPTPVLVIAPSDGSATIELEIGGVPTIASGFPAPSFPGADPTMPLSLALSVLRRGLERVAASGAPPDTEARVALTAMTGLEGVNLADAEAARSAITPALGAALEGLDGADLRSRSAMTAMGVTARWTAMRAADTAGGAEPNLFLGDEANLEAIVDIVRSRPGQTWMIAGTGGTGISAAEIILANDRDPATRVIMRGGAPPPGLMENDQFRRVVTADGDAAVCALVGVPTGAGRFSFDPGGRIGEVTASTGPDGETTYSAARTGGGPELIEGTNFIASLGRGGTPSAITAMVQQAYDNDPRSVRATPLMDGGQYLGYRITVEGRAFDITGAASRWVPGPLFNDTDLAAIQAAITAARERDAPSEGGNFDGGYVSSAAQAARYARWRRAGGAP